MQFHSIILTYYLAWQKSIWDNIRTSWPHCCMKEKLTSDLEPQDVISTELTSSTIWISNNNNILCKHHKQSNIIFFTLLLLVFKILLILFLPGWWVEENSCCERSICVFCWFCFVLHLSSLSGRHCAEEGIVGLWRRKLQPADSPKLSRAFFEIVAIFPFWKLWYFYFRNCAISIFEIVISKLSTSKLMLFLPTFPVL